VTWGTPVQSFVLLGLLVFELESMYATSDRQTDTDQSPLNAPAPRTGRGHNNIMTMKFGLEVTPDHSNWYHSKA